LLRPARGRPVLHAAGLETTQARSDHGNPFVAQEFLGEGGVGSADVGKTAEHPGPAEQLGLEPLTTRAGAQEIVDQQFHGVGAVAAALVQPLRLTFGQKEVVHASHAADRIAHADGDARPQDRGQQHVRIARYAVLALHHMDPFARPFGDVLDDHVRGPNTASIFSLRVWVVNGFTR
jgi:hypothetical protein